MNKVLVLGGHMLAYLGGVLVGRIERGEAGDYDLELLALLREEVAMDDKDKEILRLRASLRVAQQATTCAICGEYKHTPWRDDDGFICAGCLGKERDELRGKLASKRDEKHAAEARLAEVIDERDALRRQLELESVRIAELSVDRDKLLDAVDKDHTGLARALAAIKKTIDGFGWVTSSRGPYAWDDDRYREDTYTAFQAVLKILTPALAASGDIANDAWQRFERGRVWKLGAEIRRLREVAKRFGTRDHATMDVECPGDGGCDGKCGADEHNRELAAELASRVEGV